MNISRTFKDWLPVYSDNALWSAKTNGFHMLVVCKAGCTVAVMVAYHTTFHSSFPCAAGLIAKRMGLPVKFVCAVNSNDIVARMVNTGQCELGHVTPSLAPAMDMQVRLCVCSQFQLWPDWGCHPFSGLCQGHAGETLCVLSIPVIVWPAWSVWGCVNWGMSLPFWPLPWTCSETLYVQSVPMTVWPAWSVWGSLDWKMLLFSGSMTIRLCACI